MRPTFLGFETARKGLMANQKGIDVTGNNITNVNTEGYTRQRVDLISVSSSMAGSRYALKQSTFAGQGVNINGVSQTRDSFLDKRFREEYCDVGYYDKASLIMEDVESALDEVTSKGLKEGLKNMLNSLQNFSQNADQVTHANIVLTAARNLTQILRQFEVKLDNIAEQQKFDLNIDVTDVNAIFEKVANLNKAIGDDIFLTGSTSATQNEYYGPNELLDERNVLLDKLSKYGDIRVATNSDGTVKVEMNGHVVVDRKYHENINFVRNIDNTISLNWQSNGEDIKLNSGSLKASRDIINGRGSGASGEHEGFEKGVPYYKDKIDTFARVFAFKFNNTIPLKDPITGDKVEGKYVKLFEPADLGSMTAGNISVTDRWNDKPSSIIEDSYKEGEKDNSYILKLINSFNEELDFGEYKGTYEGYVNFYNTTIGEQKEFNSSRLDATAAISNDMLDRRDAISGVSMEEEGTNLMLYDKAYKAVSRLMTTLDEALDVLINRTGLVGR